MDIADQSYRAFWGNLQFPMILYLSILDWAGWGKAPAGYDAATLYYYSLLVPSVADQVYKMFSDILNTRDGVIAQLYVIARLLRRIDHGDSLDLVDQEIAIDMLSFLVWVKHIALFEHRIKLDFVHLTDSRHS